jgi:hypothetical protein
VALGRAGILQEDPLEEAADRPVLDGDVLAVVPRPAARPPSLKPLRSSTTLFVWMSMALPVVMAVARWPVKQ